MKLNINGDELELQYSFRSSIYFEQIAGHNIDLANLTANDVITLFYCVVIASLQKAKKPIVTMLEFLDIVDDNGGDTMILEFSKWYSEIIRRQFELIESTLSEEEKEEKAAKKKKTKA